jgi:hypothetical protein
MRAAVQQAYDNVSKELTYSGLPTVQVQQMAINAAAVTKSAHEAILESLFPSGSTAVAIQASGV